MIFAWNEWNLAHIARHGITPEDAEFVVSRARRPYPLAIDAEKRLVIGTTKGGRRLHVIFIIRLIDEVEAESIPLAQLDPNAYLIEVVYVIHAMPASGKQTRQDRRRRKS